MSTALFAQPREIEDISECYFYHSMDLPGHGSVEGTWDLRGGVDDYLGKVDFRGKTVLEFGTASGFLCFEMEKRGAEVIGYDLDPSMDWDIVPFARIDHREITRQKHESTEQLNNGWWFAHRAHKSRARLVHGSLYDVPAVLGPVDIVTYGSILLHVRDPFGALAKGVQHARETVIVTELHRGSEILRDAACMVFLPDAKAVEPVDTWWDLRPSFTQRALAVLGFEDQTITFHTQSFGGRVNTLYTVVARRTHGEVVAGD